MHYWTFSDPFKVGTNWATYGSSEMTYCNHFWDLPLTTSVRMWEVPPKGPSLKESFSQPARWVVYYGFREPLDYDPDRYFWDSGFSRPHLTASVLGIY